MRGNLLSDHQTDRKIFYLPVGNEIPIFSSAFHNQLGVMLKGPTGCGKTRFVMYMAEQLGVPLVTVSCHDDLSANDLVGRYLLKGNETQWVDGPLTRAVREGGICYLDEVVEARKDTVVIIHPLTDGRRILPIEKLATVLRAPPDFMLVVSFNPGYQSHLKDLKASTKQRFVTLEFGFPPPALEAEILRHESGVDAGICERLVSLGQKIRNLTEEGLEEGASTRLLVHAGILIRSGISPEEACRAALMTPLTDDPELRGVISELIASVF